MGAKPLDKMITRVRKQRVTASETWINRKTGDVIRSVVFSSTADASVVLANSNDSAEGSIVAQASISAGVTGNRVIVLLEDFAGDLYCHTLTSKALVHVIYK